MFWLRCSPQHHRAALPTGTARATTAPPLAAAVALAATIAAAATRTASAPALTAPATGSALYTSAAAIPSVPPSTTSGAASTASRLAAIPCGICTELLLGRMARFRGWQEGRHPRPHAVLQWHLQWLRLHPRASARYECANRGGRQEPQLQCAGRFDAVW